MDQNRAIDKETTEEACTSTAAAEATTEEGACGITVPLQSSSWTFWGFQHDKHKRWSNMHCFLRTITHPEEFREFFSQLKCLSALGPGHGYSMFKEGIHPSWDDPANIKGGSWHIIPKNQTTDVMEALWQQLVFSLVENAVDSDGQLCGAMASVRADKIRITVWTADCENSEVVIRIGQKLRTALKLDRTCFRYLSNEECKSKRGWVLEPVYRL